MTEKRQIEQGEEAIRITDNPVLGFRIKPDTTGDHVAGTIARAHQHGYDVLVAVDADADNEARTFADLLGAELIEVAPSYVTVDNETGPREHLIRTARDRGYPGVLWKSDQSTKVDFHRSVERLQESSDYWIESEPAPVVDPHPHVLVAVPAYNEARSVGDVVAQAKQYADTVLVVDDGSTDDTAARATAAGARVIQHEMNRGYGAALKTIFREAERCGADHLVILDGDGQHDSADIPRLVQAQKEADAEVVIGCRFGPDAETTLPLYRRFGLELINTFTNLSLSVIRPFSRIRDTQSGFRAYDRRAIRTLADDESIGDHMGASTDILHHAYKRDYRIEEVGTTIAYDIENSNSQSPISHGLTLMNNLLQTVENARPMSVIGVPGFISMFMGLGFGYATIVNFVGSGTFPLGFAILSTGFLLGGTLACFTAIILHALKQHSGG